MPETVTLEFEPPPTPASQTQKDYADLVRDLVADIETKAADGRRAAKATVLGPRRILAQSWDARPADAEPRRQLNPTLACRDKWLRIERLKTSRLFQDLYQRAFREFRIGVSAIFPFGTWLMRFRASIQINTA